MDARAALRLLEGSGLSLEEAARRAVADAGRSVETPVSVAIDAFLRDCLRRNLRESSFGFYEDKLRAFDSAARGERSMDSFDRAELRGWLDALPVAATTRRGYLAAVRAMWRWAMRQEPPMVARDVTAGLALGEPKRERSIGILTPGEAATVMAAAGSYAAMLALMLFAGVRPSEIRARGKPTMTWRQVDLVGRTVRIEAAQSKTRQPRVLEGLPANFWAWMEACKDLPLVAGFPRQATRMAREAIGRAWPQDACRHSFATYHVAISGSVERTALLMGHEGAPGMLHRHYRGLATKAEAEVFFGIVPG